MSIKSVSSKFISLILVTFFVIANVAVNSVPVQAVTTNPTARAKVSFTFDDGFKSVYADAAPTLAKYGFTGTSYVTTGCIGMTTFPNTCRADQDTSYMTWAQVQALQNTYGWEIGSHTATHPYLASFDADDGQSALLTPAQVKQEMTKSKTALTNRGINATAFASPYGDYNNSVLAEIAKQYSSHRGFHDVGLNTWPNNEYLVVNRPVQAGVSVATVRGYVDQAIANNQWLVLSFHDIFPKASNNPDDYEYKTADLDAIAAYVASRGVAVTEVSESLTQSDVNLFANGSFNSGVAGGWTTDAPNAVILNANNNGSFPDPVNSLRIAGAARQVHLFAPRVNVDPNVTYMFKNFLNVYQITSGEIGFYLDEYDSNGVWISGQWKRAERNVFVQNFNFSYRPTSSRVASTRMQVYTTPNSGVRAYLDNSQMFPLSEVTQPTPTSIVANGTFDAGISAGWTTDNATRILADATSNGSPANIVNSVRLTSDPSRESHLFSPMATINPARTYTLSNYLRIAQLTSGEVGYYIDEYDANGNWISGQYKGGARSVGTSSNQIAYTPSSTSVARARFQVIVGGGTSNISAYFDNFVWSVN